MSSIRDIYLSSHFLSRYPRLSEDNVRVESDLLSVLRYGRNLHALLAGNVCAAKLVFQEAMIFFFVAGVSQPSCFFTCFSTSESCLSLRSYCRVLCRCLFELWCSLAGPVARGWFAMAYSCGFTYWSKYTNLWYCKNYVRWYIPSITASVWTVPLEM